MLTPYLSDERVLQWILVALLAGLLAFAGLYLANPGWTPLALENPQYWQVGGSYRSGENWLFLFLMLIPIATSKALSWIEA